ncbi:hypothetical protein [Paracoccus sp. SY]|uniref:hypothetical protein n=1 Tax=Paracoccus sp. SY TaxID=1330255 RepID=UPI0013048023|nr:hypothetical protein [Paracoccus sp. SY]
MSLSDALRALNEAAYAAEKAARKSNDPRAESLRVIAWQTDGLVDQAVVKAGA